MLTRILILLCFALLAAGARADVFQYRDAEGRILLTDRPVSSGYRLVKRFSLKGTRPPPGTLAELRRRRAALSPLIDRVAGEHDMKPALIHAVVRAESAYRTNAVSSKGAMGLMQLMPDTAERFGVHNAYDAEQNLHGGTRYLRELLKMFDDNLRLALAAYNAGENAVIRYGRQIPPYPETQRYVEKVLGFYERYRGDDRVAQR
jgi:soluble lytic murein transglycosylase-like protein